MTASARTRVLVVDDDVSVADTVALVLDGAGFEVAKFYDALLAAQYALEFQPHTIITDYSMPRMTDPALNSATNCDLISSNKYGEN